MTVKRICQEVRWCYDEEAANTSEYSAASADDNALMNNIIKARICDALRWVCLYAPAEQLSVASGSAGSAYNIIVDVKGNSVPADGRISLGEDFVRLVRVRCKDWHRAVMGDSLLTEDSDEYLQLMDSNGAEATVDRPQAALIGYATKMVEVWPHSDGKSYELTKIVLPSVDITDDVDADDTDIGIPPLLLSSFLYYLAFLTLSAYEDSRAPRMLEIAKLNLGLTSDKQRA